VRVSSLPEDVSFHGASLDDLPFDQLRHTLATRHVLKVSGLFSADEILRARGIIAKGFAARTIARTIRPTPTRSSRTTRS
jgi:hypothetical protein